MKPEWAQRLGALLDKERWSVAEYHRRVNIDPTEPKIGLSAIHKYLEGKVAQPRGDVLDRLGRPFGKTRLFLEYEISNSPSQSKIPLLSMNELGTFDPVAAKKSSAWEGRSVDTVDTEDLFAVEIPDDSCWPPIKKGSVVFCKEVNASQVEPGALIVAKVDGLPAGVCRRYRSTNARDSRYFELIALNPDFAKIDASPSKPVKIIGQVAKVLSAW